MNVPARVLASDDHHTPTVRRATSVHVTPTGPYEPFTVSPIPTNLEELSDAAHKAATNQGTTHAVHFAIQIANASANAGLSRDLAIFRMTHGLVKEAPAPTVKPATTTYRRQGRRHEAGPLWTQ